MKRGMHKKDTIRISVIVAAYNQEVFIGRCLRSLLNQTMATDNYEVIVVDDGSTDKTAYALSQFSEGSDSNIYIYTHTENKGLPAALNKGIMNSSGRYIVRVDSDDFVNRNYLAFLEMYLDTNPDAGAVACDYYTLNDQEEVIRRVSAEEEPIGCAIMFRREQLLAAGLYNERYRVHEEKEFRRRFEINNEVHYLRIPLYRYRKHAQSLTTDKEQSDLYYSLLCKEGGE